MSDGMSDESSESDDGDASFRMLVPRGGFAVYMPVPQSEHGLAEPLFEPLAEAANTPRDSPPDSGLRHQQSAYTAKQMLENMSLLERWLAGQFTIVPEEHRGLDLWDIVVIAALVSTTLVLPFEVAFFRHPPRAFWLIARVVDAVFLADIFVTFQVAYTVPNALTSDWYERAPLKIARHYVGLPFSDGGTGGWFWLDVLTVFPWDAFHVESVRLVRILRLARMMRLVRVVKLMNRWQARVGTSYAFMNTFKCTILTLVAMHWLACVWGFMGLRSEFSDDQTWLKLYALKTQTDLHSFNVYEVYNLSMYFCVMTLTGVGFGDVSPSGQFEVQLSTITMFMTGFVWAWVIANVVNVVNNLDAYLSFFQKLNDDLNMLMESRGLSRVLQTRCRKHLHEAYKVHRQSHQKTTIRALSLGLQGEIALQSGADQVCNCVWYLRDVDQDVLVELVNYFLPNMFSPGEFIIHKQAVSVIRRGSCWFKSHILMRDSIIGEDMLLDSEYLRDTIFPKTLNYVEVMTLQREDLQHVCEKFPDFSRKIRMAQIRLAFRRGFIYYSRQIQVLRTMPGKISREMLSIKSLPARDKIKPPRFFTTNDRQTQLYNLVAELKHTFEECTEDIRWRQESLAKQISRIEPSVSSDGTPPAETSLPASSGQTEQLAGTTSALQGSALLVRLEELEAAQLRLANRVGALAEQQAQVVQLKSLCGQLPQDQAAGEPMDDLTAPRALLAAAAQATPSSLHDDGEQDLMDKSHWSSGPSGDIGGTSPCKLERFGTAEPRWAKRLLVRLDALEQGLSRRHDALEASLALQLRHSEDIERKLAEHIPSRSAETAPPALLDELKRLSDSITDSVTDVFARQQSWFEVQTKVLQSRFSELSSHSCSDAKSGIDQGRLEKIIRQKGLSLETAVSAQLMDFGTALRQRTESQLDILRQGTADLVKRQSEALKASLAAQLDCLEVDCLRQAQRACGDCCKKQDEGLSPMSRSPSRIHAPSSPEASA